VIDAKGVRLDGPPKVSEHFVERSTGGRRGMIEPTAQFFGSAGEADRLFGKRLEMVECPIADGVRSGA
jgi:hypothetical protein